MKNPFKIHSLGVKHSKYIQNKWAGFGCIPAAAKLIIDEGRKTGNIFETITEQKMNEQLKDIAKKVKLNKAITNHSARHTFATLFIAKTKDVATLQRLLGHSRITETMVYVHIDETVINEQMGNFGRLLCI